MSKQRGFSDNHYVFRPNWPSPGVRVVVLKLLFCFSTVIALGYFYVGIILLPCMCSVYL
jgi:hypothetical protein